jgi:hypothetical protein
VAEGSVDDRRFVATYAHDGVLVAALAMNMPAKIVHYEKLIGGPAPGPP